MDKTNVTQVYDAFFDRITDDMYMEIGIEQTKKDCWGLLLSSLPLYEFPKKVISLRGQEFNRELSLEEINILATGMVQLWLQRQITSIELTRQKYSGADFKLTSQANHLQALTTLFNEVKAEHRRLQMLQSRREIVDDEYHSTFNKLVRR